MSEHTGISWTDHTFNPWWGCAKVSPACDHCYAERDAHRFAPATTLWGVDAERRTFGDTHWAAPLRWHSQAAREGRRARVFCASMADVFDKNAPDGARERLWSLITATPHLDWLLLTKRIGNAERFLPGRWQSFGMPCNVWLGITVVNQEEADRDIPKLLTVPARVRFLSIEPMLGPIELLSTGDPFHRRGRLDPLRGEKTTYIGAAEDGRAMWAGSPCERLDWVIAGGESGPHARPAHPDWFRSLRDQCAAAGVPFHFKQWGEWTPGENVERVRGTVDTAFLYNDEWHIHPLNLATDHGHIDDQPDLYLVGKKAAGRLLDGRTHDEFPTGRVGIEGPKA